MRNVLLISMATAFAFASCLANGICQGLAEYSATTSHAAAATAKAGSVLNKATQQLTGNVKEKLSGSIQQPRQTSRKPGQVQPDHPGSFKVLTIQSSKGSVGACGDVKTSDPKAGPQTDPCVSSQAKNPPGDKASLASKSKTDGKYPSAVTLSFPK